MTKKSNTVELEIALGAMHYVPDPGKKVCIKKDYEKFKILDILAVTTQAHEGIETISCGVSSAHSGVTTHKKVPDTWY